MQSKITTAARSAGNPEFEIEASTPELGGCLEAASIAVVAIFGSISRMGSELRLAPAFLFKQPIC
jgi:hypothetical protein